MKALLLALLIASPVVAQTTAELEAQIKALQTQIDSTLADSTAQVMNTTMQADSTMQARGIVVTNRPHPNGNYDSQWVAVDLSALSGIEKTYSAKLLVSEHKGQQSGDFVRIRKDRIAAAIVTLKALLE